MQIGALLDRERDSSSREADGGACDVNGQKSSGKHATE
jgi:hypothetical protein